jgi:hypothetical protein
MLWCICADYIARDLGPIWVWRAAAHAQRGANDCAAVMRAANHAMSTGPMSTRARDQLDQLAVAIFLWVCPQGGTPSEDDRERRVALLHREIRRRRDAAIRWSLPPPPERPVQLDPASWKEYEEESKQWYESRGKAISDAFYSWAAAHPEADENSDFTILIANLAAIWRDGRVMTPI